MRHYTSRAGDPHRHLHLQVNARVLAEGTWRGLHTVGVRDALAAINGIGHAAVMCDPDFRAALAGHGFTLETGTGEIVQLARFVGPFSARAAQIGRNIDRYETTWRAAHPGGEPSPKVRRSWDARAWAEDRPDKVAPQGGADLTRRWVQELIDLGYRDPDPSPTSPPMTSPTPSPAPAAAAAAAAAEPVRVGTLDRDSAAELVLTRLGAARSWWNAADVRGQVEQLIAATGITCVAAARLELAEDLTARAVTRCLPLLRLRGVPEHIRALTSRPVLDVEADLAARFTARAAAGGHPLPEPVLAIVPIKTASPVACSGDGFAAPGWGRDGWDAGFDTGLDAGQRRVVAALAGTQGLLVVEGAAGAGKTTTLAATRTVLQQQGRRLVVVTPTLQAARIAAQQVGAAAFSAAWLAHQHGHRWDNDGRWTQLRVGDADPVTGGAYLGPAPAAVLAAGDLLLVDEAGMLDQDTARALMAIADTAHARVALVGDRHQLPAVGRGGVLDLAAHAANADGAHPGACLTLDAVHRFADPTYAQLTLSMRTGGPDGPGVVFDALLARGQVRFYPTPAERTQALSEVAAAAVIDAAAAVPTTTGANTLEGRHGQGVVLVADTREQVAELNASIRERLVAAGHLTDTTTVTTWAGERVGVGDHVVTRHNDTGTDVANRDTWTVTGLRDDGTLLVTGRSGHRVLPAGYVRDHVQLGYASTIYGAQGVTTGAAHLVVGEHTGAAGAYVAMTRGRETNTAHLVADTLQAAREQWVEVFGRDRADLGPAHAARLAAHESAFYAPHRPHAVALADLRAAWTHEHALTQDLATARHNRYQLAQVVAPPADHNHADHAHYADYDSDHDKLVAARLRAYQQARATAAVAGEQAARLGTLVGDDTVRRAGRLAQEWDTGRADAAAAGQTVRAGGGRIGQHRGAVRRARHHLQEWADRWRPVLAWLPTDTNELAVHVGTFDDPDLGQALTASARTAAEAAHPDHAPAQTLADTARHTADQALDAYHRARTSHAQQPRHPAQPGHPAQFTGSGDPAGLPDPAAHLAQAEQDLAELTDQVHAAHAAVRAALAEPAIRSLPAEQLEAEHQRWATEPQQERHTSPAPAADHHAAPVVAPTPTSSRRHERSAAHTRPTPGPGISR